MTCSKVVVDLGSLLPHLALTLAPSDPHWLLFFWPGPLTLIVCCWIWQLLASSLV